MKVTKEYIKKLILEELQEQEAKLSSGDFKKQQLKQATAVQSGVDDKERAILAQIEEKLRQYASKGRLGGSGIITNLLTRLNAELDKVLKK